MRAVKGQAMEIRAATPDDLPAIQAIYAPYVRETSISFEEEVPSLSALSTRMKAAHIYLVAEDENGILGYAYASEHRSRAAYRFSCDVSVYVARHTHRKGIGTALYDELLPRLKAMGFHNAYGGLNLPNPASVALHEAFNFHHIGTFREVGFKFGKWHDVGWWERHL